MRMMIRRSFCSIVLALALFLISGYAQRPEAARPRSVGHNRREEAGIRWRVQGLSLGHSGKSDG